MVCTVNENSSRPISGGETTQLIATNYFITLAKGSCNTTVISLRSSGSAGTAVPRSAVPLISLPRG